MTTRYKRLWADVPDRERVSEAFLKTRAGSRDPRWLVRHMDRLNNTGSRCPAAVQWEGECIWQPCPFTASAPDGFCHIHTSHATEYHHRREESRALKDTKREYARLMKRRDELGAAFAGVQARLRELETMHSSLIAAHTVPTNSSPMATRSEQSEGAGSVD